MSSLEIALATFNSSEFLPEQLDSLFRQTNQDFKLLISDDGSNDSTFGIIADFSERHPGRIRLIQFPTPAGGACANFSRLLDQVTADYVMFCDHDDVWLPGKVALSLKAIKALEDVHGADLPLMFHTDLCVTGPDLEVWRSSFWNYSNTDPNRNSFNNLLMTSIVAGCTLIANRALYEMARPIPHDSPMHDSWLALVAGAFGKIAYSRDATVLYRQHGNNVLGATEWGPGHIARRIVGTIGGDGVKPLTLQARQAEAFLARYGNRMNRDQIESARAMAGLWSRPRRKRFLGLVRANLLRRGWLQRAALLLTVSAFDGPRAAEAKMPGMPAETAPQG